MQKSNDIPTEFIIPENWLVPKIKDGVLSDKKITLFYGWRDGGKSTSCVKILIFKCLLDVRFRCAHVRQHYNELSGTTFQQIQDVINELGLNDKFTITKDGFRIINKNKPNNYFFGASGDKPDKIRSTPDVTHIFWDEFHDATEETFGSVLGTLREKEDVRTKFIALFNNDKIKAKSFIDKSFFDLETRVTEDVETILVKHTDNPFIDQKETKKKLMMVCLGDEGKYNSLTRGDFVVFKTGQEWASSFDKNKHVKECHYDPELPIHVSFDFNSKPYMSAVIKQIEIGERTKVYQVGEYALSHPNNSTEDVCKAILRDYEPYGIAGIYYYGDSSGRNQQAKKTRDENTHHYDVIAREFSDYTNNHSDRVVSYNPPLVKRKNFYIKLLTGYLGIDYYIDPSCTHTIEDFEQCKEDANGGILKPKTKDANGATYEKHGHHLDADNYFSISVFKNLFELET